MTTTTTAPALPINTSTTRGSFKQQPLRELQPDPLIAPDQQNIVRRASASSLAKQQKVSQSSSTVGLKQTGSTTNTAPQRQRHLSISQGMPVAANYHRKSVCSTPAADQQLVQASSVITTSASEQQHNQLQRQCDTRNPNQLQEGSGEYARRKSSALIQPSQQDPHLDNNYTRDSSGRMSQRTGQAAIATADRRNSTVRGVAGFIGAPSSNLMKQQQATHRFNQQQQVVPAAEASRPIQQQGRRASVAISDLTSKQPLHGNQSDSRISNFSSIGPRKQSTAFFTQNSVDFQRFSLEQAYYERTREQLGSCHPPVPNVASSGSRRSSQMFQPQTMITASSDVSVSNNSNGNAGSIQEMLRRGSTASQNQLGTTLIPVPPDQIHLRRLSDQSNLFRRSSIIADTIDAISVARNRSHSNIDTIAYSNYLYQTMFQQQQQPSQNQAYPAYSDENLHHAQQQQPAMYPMTDQHPAYMAQDMPGVYPNKDQYHPQQQQQQQQAQHPVQQMSSIITPYSQKQRRSSDEIHSDSSSDIEDEARNAQEGYEFDNEQPNEYFAPPRPFNTQPPGHDFIGGQTTNNQTNQYFDSTTNNTYNNQTNQQPPIAIPSVSVSEFRSSQQRLNQSQKPVLQYDYDRIMTTPMQINVAIEQVIKKQEQQMHQTQQLNNLLGTNQPGFLVPRRGSSGRILPKVPGEQSISLLELARTKADSKNNISNDQQTSMLDLPCVSPTIRRASAPEGQNIKIVVDDIDGRGGVVGSGQYKTVYGKQSELYERLVLYRDDSLDPNTNMAQGFGLHVTGGKIDDDGDDKLQACVSWTLPGGPADKVGLRRGDKIIEWDGKCLVNMSYEQVAEVIESSANIAELLVKPAQRLEPQPGANFVRSGRRLSQQTERDLKKNQQPIGVAQFGTRALADRNRNAEWNSSNQSVSGSISRRDSFQNSNNIHLTTQQQQQLQQQSFDKPPTIQTALSAGNSPARTGTGRRLPQIPGMNIISASSNTNIETNVNLASAYSSRSTGQLEHINPYITSSNSHMYKYGDDNNLGILQNNELKVSLLHNGSSVGAINSLNWPIRRDSISNQNGYSNSTTVLMDNRYGSNNGGINQAPQYLSTQVSDQICGLIGLQVNVDDRTNQLEICVLSAINMDVNPSQEHYVRVRILPEE